jgi:MFS superfamily sulfate permease-like transporter
MGWLAGYERGRLRFDVIAGLTVTAILIPEGMAYAQLPVSTAGRLLPRPCRPARTPPSTRSV